MAEESTFVTLLVVALLLILNGLFVAFEFALIRLRAEEFEEGETEGLFRFGLLRGVLTTPEYYIAVAQIGITAASILLGFFAQQRLYTLFVEQLGGASAYGFTLSVLGAFLLLVFLHAVFGELVAKAIALARPRETLIVLAPPMFILGKLMSPMMMVVDVAARGCLRVFGINEQPVLARVHTAAELESLITHSGQHGELAKDEQEMIHGVFDFSKTLVREVMTPRTDLQTLHIDDSLETVLECVSATGYSRLPVIGETVDDVKGILIIKDVLPKLPALLAPKAGPFKLESVIREPLFVPGTRTIDELLRDFKLKKQHLAVVLDEHGGVDGVVSLEDLLEEIVGEIFDESDIAESEILVHGTGQVLVEGGVLVDELNDRFDLGLPEGEYDTIAGLVLTRLGRLPKEGEVISLNGDALERTTASGEEQSEVAQEVQLKVKRLSGQRIEQIEIAFQPAVAA